jgi:Fe2+ transport system protein FeoA
MGLVPRAVVRVDRLAPLGDPIWVRLGDNGTQMALRRQEAKTVMVDIIADASAPKESL